MTGKILRNSYLVAISALLASALLFFGVMYRDYEDEAFARLRAETSAIAQGLGAQGASYFDGFEPDDRVTWVDASGSVLYDSAAPAEQLSNHTGREEIDRALEDGEAQSSRYSQTLLQRTFYYARRMADGTVLRVSCTQKFPSGNGSHAAHALFMGRDGRSYPLRRAVLSARAEHHKAHQRHSSGYPHPAARLP